MHVYIVRHTSVVLDGNETCYGDMDIDVRHTFEEEASLTRAALEGLSFDGVKIFAAALVSNALGTINDLAPLIA
ncbi:MAG: hypothetical protein ACFN22_03750, partial [Porphyromonas pasteri]